MSFCSLGHWCQVNIALVHAIINSSIPSTSFTPTCANTIPAYISAHLDNVHSLGEHKFLADAKDWNAFCAFLQGLEQQTGTKFTVDAKRMSHGRLLIKQTCMYGNKPSWTERKNLSNRLLSRPKAAGHSIKVGCHAHVTAYLQPQYALSINLFPHGKQAFPQGLPSIPLVSKVHIKMNLEHEGHIK